MRGAVQKDDPGTAPGQTRMAPPAAGPLVRDADSMAEALRRLMYSNDCVLFYNEQQTLKLMLRNDPIDAETIAFELCIVVPEDDDAMLKLVDLNNDGYLDDPTTYVLDSWSYPLEGFGAEQARKPMEAVNRAYELRVCPCGRYLVKDHGTGPAEATACVFCTMVAAGAEARAEHYCPICCEQGARMHMALQPCCQQLLHSSCLATWHAKSDDERCPLCRAEPGAG